MNVSAVRTASVPQTNVLQQAQASAQKVNDHDRDDQGGAAVRAAPAPGTGRLVDKTA